MNQTTQLPREFVSSTTPSTFQELNHKIPASAGHCMPTILVHPYQFKSPRTGRRSVAIMSEHREALDSSFKKRMTKARVLLAEEFEEMAGKTLASVRLSKGKTQAGLAASIGTSQPHIAKIEAGKVQLEFATASKIADALSITLDELRLLLPG